MNSRLYNVLAALCVALVVAGAGVLIGLWAVPQFDAWRVETQVSSMRQAASSSSSTEEGSRQLSEAHSYNSSLAGEGQGSATPYDGQLGLLGNDALCWLEIPSIGLERPVYRHDSDDVLMAGLGHIEGTSLPVGGRSTHCCVTGHSGMVGSYMFDDLDKVGVGDVFVFWTLGDPYAYRVYDVEVVDPDDVSGLHIVAGRDLATLVTCTPYGINSHRLLVHGERTDYVPGEEPEGQLNPTSGRLWTLGAGLVATAALVGLLLYALLGGRSLRLVLVSDAAGEAVWGAGGLGAGSGASSGASPSGTGGTAQVAGTRSEMGIELKPFGRARVNLGGGETMARWHREAGGYVIDLGATDSVSATGPVEVTLGKRIAIRQVDGEWVADALVNHGSGTLTFR